MQWINLAKIITKQEIRDGIRKKEERESALKTPGKHHGGAGMKKTERHNLIILEKLVQDIQTQMGPAMSHTSHGDDDPSKI